MKKFTTDDIHRISKEFGQGIPGLDDELKVKLMTNKIMRDQAEKIDVREAVEKEPSWYDFSPFPDVPKLRESLVHISKDADVKKALQDFWGNVIRIGKPDASKYKLIEDALSVLSLKDADIL